MRQDGRNLILWIGEDLLEGWVSAASELGLTMRAEQSPPKSPEPSLRTIVLPVRGMKLPQLRRNLAECIPAMDTGAQVIVLTMSDDKDLQLAVALDVDEFVQQHKMMGAPLPLIHRPQISPSSLPFLRLSIAHDPGPAPSPSLTINGPRNTPPDIQPEDFTLLCRLFSDLGRIEIESQRGGRSAGGAVWRVRGFDRTGRETAPYIAKCGPVVAITQEHNVEEAMVQPFIEFSNRPSRTRHGCIRATSRAAIAATLVPSSTQLDRYLLEGGDGIAAAQAIFNSMRYWRSYGRYETVSPGQYYAALHDKGSKSSAIPYPVLPQLDQLNKTHMQCVDFGLSVRSPEQLLELLTSQPPIVTSWCVGHGDLNCRNVLMREATSDVVLIDFSHCDNMMSSRDPAHLEVSAAFDVGSSDIGFLNSNDLDALFRGPLLAPATEVSSDQRIRFVCETRRLAAQASREPEYAVNVACHLLRFARHRDPPATTAAILGLTEEDDRLRIHAYRIAHMLIERHCQGAHP